MKFKGNNIIQGSAFFRSFDFDTSEGFKINEKCITSARHAGVYSWTAELADWCACERPSVVSTTFQPPHDGRPWPVSVNPPPQPCTEKLVVDWCCGGWGETRACDRVRRRVVHVRARAPQPDRRRRDRRIPISSAPRHTYPAGRSTTTAQPHSPTTRPPPCTPRVFADRYQTILIIVINRNIVTAIVSDFPFSLSCHSAGLFRSRFPSFQSRDRFIHVRPLTDRRTQGSLAGMTIIDYDGLSGHRTRQDTSQVSLWSVSTTRQSQ